MKIQYFQEWQAVCIVQVVWFSILSVVLVVLVAASVSSVSNRKRFWTFCGYLGVFFVCKVVGGVLGLVFMHQHNFNENLYIATYVFDSISLGFMLKSMFPLISTMLRREKLFEEEKVPQELKILLKYGPLDLLTLIVLVAVILSIVGSNMLASSDGNAVPNKVSALLFLAATIVLAAIMLFINFDNPQYLVPARLLLLAAGILVIRCAYSILSTFNHLSLVHYSKYSLIFGDYKYFTFLALMEEALVGVVLLLTFQWFLRNRKL